MDVTYLTPPEIAKLLRCRESKVLGWIRSGRLAAVNLSESRRPRYRIGRQALDDFLVGRAVSPESKPTRRSRRGGVPHYV